MTDSYYVYSLCDGGKPVNKTYQTSKGDISFTYEPIYIGKGKNFRMFSHTHSASLRKDPNYTKRDRLVALKNQGLLVRQKLVEQLPEQEALTFESELIQLLGRKDLKTGMLLNLSNGQEVVLSKASRYSKKKKMSKHKISCYDAYGNCIFKDKETFEILETYKININTIYSLIKGKYFSPTFDVFMFFSNETQEKIDEVIIDPKYNRYRKREWGSKYSIYKEDVLIYEAKGYGELSKLLGKHDYPAYSKMGMTLLGEYKVVRLTNSKPTHRLRLLSEL